MGGRPRLSPAEVESDQRRRILAAMATVLAEHGYARATVAHVIKQAGVSRRTFYEQFADKEDCMVATYEDAERRLWVEVAAAVAAAPAGDWPQRVHAGLGAALAFLAAEPATARLFTLEARAAGSPIAERHRAALYRLALMLRAGNRAVEPAASKLPPETERFLVANVAAMVGVYVVADATEQLPGLTSQLAEHLLMPYRDSE